MHPAPYDQTITPMSAAYDAMLHLLGANDALDSIAVCRPRDKALPEQVTGALVTRARAMKRARQVMLGRRHG